MPTITPPAIDPALGRVALAGVSATVLLTPWQDGQAALRPWLAQAQRTCRTMLYSATLAPFFDQLIAWRRARTVQWRGIFDHSEVPVRAEAAQLARLTAAGYRDGVDFLIGTSPAHRALNHLKAAWLDGRWVWDGSWNYSEAADAETNTITLWDAPALAAAYEAVFAATWTWIQQHEPAYQQP